MYINRRSTLIADTESADPMRENAYVPNLFRRHPGNPLLSAADWPYAAHSVFNQAITKGQGDKDMSAVVEQFRMTNG